VFLGVLIMLIASALYNSAPIFLRIATRALPARTGAALVRAVLTQKTGLLGLALSLLGWGLSVVALTILPFTLARVLFATGLGLLLLLCRRTLREPLRQREVLGAAAFLLGMVAVVVAAPARSTISPSPVQWLLLLVLLVPLLLLPSALRQTHHAVGATVLATSAGMGYALSALFSKELANLLHHAQALPLLLALAGAAACAGLGFVDELGGLERGEAAVVAPIYLALQTVIPIVCAPLLFREQWPAAAGYQGLLAGGILLTLVGIVIVSHHHEGVVQAYARAAG
jgi:hypothetical protein